MLVSESILTGIVRARRGGCCACTSRAAAAAATALSKKISSGVRFDTRFEARALLASSLEDYRTGPTVDCSGGSDNRATLASCSARAGAGDTSVRDTPSWLRAFLRRFVGTQRGLHFDNRLHPNGTWSNPWAVAPRDSVCVCGAFHP